MTRTPTVATVADDGALRVGALPPALGSWVRAGVWFLPAWALMLAASTVTHQPDYEVDFADYARYVTTAPFLISHLLLSIGGAAIGAAGAIPRSGVTEFVAPFSEHLAHHAGLTRRDLVVSEAAEFVERIGHGGRGEPSVELQSPSDAVLAGEALGEGEEIGEVPSFGAVEDGEYLASGEVLGASTGRPSTWTTGNNGGESRPGRVGRSITPLASNADPPARA